MFRTLSDDSPVVAKVPDAVRQPLRALHDTNARHSQELAGAIRQLGGTPHPRPAPDDPYLKYLSLKFLLPKLVTEKELMMRRYENALRALPKTAPKDVTDLLQRQRAEQAGHVDTLTAAADREIAAGR